MTSQDLVTAAAFHEAGHVVAAIAVGLEVHFSTIRADNRGHIDGYTELIICSADEPEAATTPEMLRKRTVQALAGYLAEILVNHNHEDANEAAAGDADKAARFAVMAMRPDPAEAPQVVNRYLDERDQEARSLLLQHVPAINAIARYLFDHLNQDVSGEILKNLMVVPAAGMDTPGGEQ